MTGKRTDEFAVKVLIDLHEYQNLLLCKRKYFELLNNTKIETKKLDNQNTSHGVKHHKEEEVKKFSGSSNLKFENTNQFGEGNSDSESSNSSSFDEDDSESKKPLPMSSYAPMSSSVMEKNELILPKETQVLIAHLPYKYQTKAKTIFLKLMPNPNFQYNSETLEVSLYNKVIPGSNIKKVLLSSFRNKLRKRHPKGLKEFLAFLEEQGIDENGASNSICSEQPLKKHKVNIPSEEMPSVGSSNTTSGALPWYFIA